MPSNTSSATPISPPAGFDSWFSEKIVRLPACVGFAPFPNAPPPNQLPAVGNGYVTFGSFNHPSKIAFLAIDMWSVALSATPDSRLIVFNLESASTAQSIPRALAEAGVDPRRIETRGRLPMRKYLQAHREVDICLDTLPYSGGTTTLHALSMGVPTLPLLGKAPPGHVGVSLLKAVGLDAFTAATPADLVALARRWALHRDDLAALRAQLPSRLAGSAIGSPGLIAASLERALRLMWQRWCAGLQPFGISVGLADRPPSS